jgi:DNA-binding transcriptional regulator YhcF (GntR family)
MLLKLDVGDHRPLYQQIASAVRRAVSDGSVVAGDRLPAARDLAASLDVNMHTVLRAYGDLRDEGLIELRRGRGAVVVATAEANEITRRIAELVRAARHDGVSRRDLVHLIEEEYS